ncbi:MAG: MFS transporter [Prosthecobacter sp.]|nr:MFS transporter [Prosthecobacter sp.]
MNAPSTSIMTRAWLTVGMLFVVGVLNNLDRIMLTTMRLSIKEAIPMSDAQFGLLTSAFLWSYAALNPLAGFLADRFNRSRVIITGLFVWSLMTWLTGHARSYDELVAVRIGMGISEACFLPAALALIADYHGTGTRALASGIVIAGLGVGSALGGLGGWLAERQGWQYAFTLFGIGGMTYAALLLFTLRDAPPAMRVGDAPAGTRGAGMGEALASLLGNGSFRLILFCWGIIGIAGWAVLGWMPTYLNEQFQLPQGTAGIMATSYPQVAGLFGLLIGGFWADRWSRTNARARNHVAVIGLGIAAAGIFICAQSGILVVCLGGLILYGLTRVFLDANMMPILCTACDARYRATGFGLMNLLSCLLGGVSLYAGGALRDARVDVSTMFFLAAAILILCAVAVFMVRPRASLLAEFP